MSSQKSRYAGHYAHEEAFRPGDNARIPRHRRGNPTPAEFSGKARLAQQRQRYSGYTSDEMRSMLVRLGFKHPELLVTRLDLMNALDQCTQVVN